MEVVEHTADSLAALREKISLPDRAASAAASASLTKATQQFRGVAPVDELLAKLAGMLGRWPVGHLTLGACLFATRDLATLPTVVWDGDENVTLWHRELSADTTTAFWAGVDTTDALIDSGSQIIAPLPWYGSTDIQSRLLADALISLYTSRGIPEILNHRPGAKLDDNTWMSDALVIQHTLLHTRPIMAEHLQLFDHLQAPALAFSCGMMLAAAARRVPCLIDHTYAAAAALIATRISFRVPRWMIAATAAVPKSHAVALGRLNLDPLVQEQVNEPVLGVRWAFERLNQLLAHLNAGTQ